MKRYVITFRTVQHGCAYVTGCYVEDDPSYDREDVLTRFDALDDEAADAVFDEHARGCKRDLGRLMGEAMTMRRAEGW